MTLEQTVPIGFQELIIAAQSLLVGTCEARDRLEVSFSSTCRPTLHPSPRIRPSAAVALRIVTVNIFLPCYSPQPLEVQGIGLSLWIQLPPWSSDLEY